jgi:hypothetical protein
MNERYTFIPTLMRDLLDIESARQIVNLTMPPQVASMRTS